MCSFLCHFSFGAQGLSHETKKQTKVIKILKKRKKQPHTARQATHTHTHTYTHTQRICRTAGKDRSEEMI